MRNYIALVISFLMLSSTFTNAQIFDDVQVGAKLNANYSKIRLIHGDSEAKFGFGAGLVAVKPINYSQEYNIQVELSFNQYGEKNEDADKSETINLNYITLPILFKGYFSDQETEVFGLIGPQMGFLVGESDFNNETYNSFDVGITGGIGLSLDRKFETDLRIYYGFLDSAEEFRGENRHNNNFALSLGISYLF